MDISKSELLKKPESVVFGKNFTASSALRKLKVLLIDPHYRSGRIGPNIGVAYICAAVKECADIKLMHFFIRRNLDFDEFLDAEKRFIEDIKREIALDHYDVVSITGTSGTYPRMLRIAEAVKKASPDSLFVVGGPHITIMEASRWKNRIFKDSSYVDVIVKGEGEETFKELLYAISNRKDFSNIKGISYKKKDNIFSNPLREVPDINKLPIPDYEKFDKNHFSKLPFYILASRGCKYNCLFCDERKIFNCYRPRDPKLVIKELKILVNKLGIKNFWFGDSTLTSHPKLMELCDLIIKEKLGIEFMCFGRVNEVNPEMLKKLKEAGCFCVYYGIESGNQEILNWMRKGITLEQIRKAVRISKEIGLAIIGSFIIGCPPETKEMALETIEFAKSLNINVERWHIFEPSIDFLENAPEEYDVDWKSMEINIPVALMDELVKRMKKRGDALSFDRHFITYVKGNVNEIKSPFSKIPYNELQELIHKAQEGAGDHQ